jgi:hypothetical protein
MASYAPGAAFPAAAWAVGRHFTSVAAAHRLITEMKFRLVIMRLSSRANKGSTFRKKISPINDQYKKRATTCQWRSAAECGPERHRRRA